MTYRLRNIQNNNSKIIHFIIVLFILSNIGGFCVGYLVGEYQQKQKNTKRSLFIEKEINKIS